MQENSTSSLSGSIWKTMKKQPHGHTVLNYSFFHSFIHSKKEKYVPTYYIISITTGESDTKLHHLPLSLTFLGGITDAGWDGGGCSVAMLAIVPSISIF